MGEKTNKSLIAVFRKCSKKGNEAGAVTKIGGGPQTDRAITKMGRVREANHGKSQEERRKHPGV